MPATVIILQDTEAFLPQHKFSNEVYFNKVHFKKAIFVFCNFDNTVSFEQATFNDDVNFNASIFNGLAQFISSKFSGKINISQVYLLI